MKNIGLLIKDARKQAGLTQKALAEQLSCSVPHLGRIEIGSVKPSIGLLEKMFTILPFVFYQLFKLHDDPLLNDALSRLLQQCKHLTSEQLNTLNQLASLMKKENSSKIKST